MIWTIVIGLALAAGIAAVIIKLARDRKKGAGSCGRDCGQCPYSC